MQPISSLVSKLAADFPSLRLAAGGEFRWSPDEQVIFYDAASSDASSLLHELAHAILGHAAYDRDIELLELERAAWQHATRLLAPKYGVSITDTQVEDALDTYRDWLHARSTCPACQATGLQVKKNEYKCIACQAKWRVNDARICGLRRYTLPK
jgi:Zn-dependent peptidase ImmA (M78 family)